MKTLLISGIALLFLKTGIAVGEEKLVERAKANFPETEIFLFELDLSSQENVLSKGQNVTRRSGYDNQPYFTPDGKSFLYSRGDEYQTDVYEYFLDSGKTMRLSESTATEFSPTPTPDNKSITFVSDRSNSIWIGDRTKINDPSWAQQHNNNHEPVGYYAWNHNTGDILYWSQYGFSLSLVHESTADYHFVSGHAVPSTPHIIPGTNDFSFVHRQTNGQVWIKRFNPVTKSITPITPIVGSNANYGWTQAGAILMIENNVLHQWVKADDNGWQAIADLSKHGITNANRIAISPDMTKLAVVGLESD